MQMFHVRRARVVPVFAAVAAVALIGAAGASAVTTSPNGSNTDYAVGGGRTQVLFCENPRITYVEKRFALHAPVDAAAHGDAGTGTFNLAMPASQGALCGLGEGQISGKIDCVEVGGAGSGTT